MDEVFYLERGCDYRSSPLGGQSAELLGNVSDFLLWYGRDAAQVNVSSTVH